MSPYIFRNFNVKTYYGKFNKGSKSLARLVNPLIEALNENDHLPKICLILPDKDIWGIIDAKNTRASVVIRSSIHYIVKQMDMYFDHRKLDLEDKKPGALLDTENFPKIVWVHMLKRPKSLVSDGSLFSVRGKFSSILEEHLMDGHANCHHIISIEVDLNEFVWPAGQSDFYWQGWIWCEINRGIKKFDLDEIMLRPRQYAMKNFQSKKVYTWPTHQTRCPT